MSTYVATTNPIWPLPRRGQAMSDEQVLQQVDRYDAWQYAYAFEGGLNFSARHERVRPVYTPDRHLQRFRQIMPDLLAACGGSLAGKRVLDIGCNSGFWSMQCALLGADVVGFDARAEMVEQAHLLQSITGIANMEFHCLDYWDMSTETLGGRFDIVLNLGMLYHLPKPLEALERCQAMAREHILLDTFVDPSSDATVAYRWEKPDAICNAADAGITCKPSKAAVELMLRHMGCAQWLELPLRNPNAPKDYQDGRRATWLIQV